jgi:hypothetical protein
MSYHQGSVWPLFTGWAALAQYRGGQPLAGYQTLMENANLTKAQDLGAVTELLSGDFFVPFGRSTSHQLWSSAMVITPTLRGLFGISVDAQTKTITVNQQLPPGWGKALVRNLRVGSDTVDLFFGFGMDGQRTVELQSHGDAEIKLTTQIEGAKRKGDKIEIPRPIVEIEPIFEAPLPGSRTQSVRILNESRGDHRLTVTLEGIAGSDAQVGYYLHDLGLKVSVMGAELNNERHYASVGPIKPPTMTVHFPPGEGWKTTTVTLTW